MATEPRLEQAPPAGARLCRAITPKGHYVLHERPCARVGSHKFKRMPACYAHAERARAGKPVKWSKPGKRP